MSSGVTLTKSHHALRHGDQGRTMLWLAVTIALGLVFLSLQVHEYGQAMFAFTDGIYPSVFYMATGFHGFHVFVGVCFLTVCLHRVRRGDFTRPGMWGSNPPPGTGTSWTWCGCFSFVWVYWWGNVVDGRRPQAYMSMTVPRVPDV